ncbi:MAG: mercuric reductase [bacterium]
MALDEVEHNTSAAVAFATLGTVLRDGDPDDERLRAHVQPTGWTNPEPAERYNLVVIGGGTAGLVAAAGAAGLGARVALIEAHMLGGDCLNSGCVPSKALLRSARVAAELGHGAELGFPAAAGTPDSAAALRRMRQLRADLAPIDSAERFRTELGIDVFQGRARFTSADEIAVGDARLRFRRAVVATGASPVLPDIPGLAAAGVRTNESIFALDAAPARLAVVGGGPIGCELAQAFQRLGARVTILLRGPSLLPREDRAAAAIVEEALLADGVQILRDVRIETMSREGETRQVHYRQSGALESLAVDEILVAAGRSPNIDGLGLASAGIAADSRTGIEVNDRLQTTNPAVYASGDVCLSDKFTHAADFSSRIVIQNALFRGSRKRSALLIPRCTYTDPEIASVGVAASEDGGSTSCREWLVPFADLDRARLDGETNGFVRILTPVKGDKIIGATIVARHAGEMIGEVCVAMQAGVGLGALANITHPYPTQADAIRKAGDLYNRTRLTPLVKRLFRLWFRWNR